MVLTLKRRAEQRILQGERLVQANDIHHAMEIDSLNEGQVYPLHNKQGKFVAQLLVGRQHKGLGWIISLDQDQRWTIEYVESLIEAALMMRQRLFAHQNHTNAWRIFNGEGDGIGGITIDWYHGYMLINYYSIGIYKYHAWFEQILQELMPEVQGIYETRRFINDMTEANRHVAGEEAPRPHLIQENGINYAVYLGEDWMTGIFLDQREVRDFVRSQAQNLKVLNLFSYTGAFSVAAAMGGAAHTVSVDVAKRSLDLTQEQFVVNQIQPTPDKHEIRVMDVFEYIEYAKRHQLKFDLIICDPPSFARTKKTIWRVEEDYRNMAKELLDLLYPNGMGIFSTNAAKYTLANFRHDIEQATLQANGEYIFLTQYRLPQDFPTSQDALSQYLKVLIYYKSA